MATAWHTVKYQDHEHILRPILVTGMKLWHIREESQFYPKINFWNGVRQSKSNKINVQLICTVPPKSKVIFLFGEIDCREGLLLAVEKCRYDVQYIKSIILLTLLIVDTRRSYC